MQAGIEDIIATAPPDPPPAARPADPTLVSLAARAAHDDEAFDLLYGRLDGGLRRFLSRRGVTDRDRVEELAQLVWVDVWQALRAGRYDPARAAITTFLYAVAYKVWLQHRRQLRVAPPHDPDALARLRDDFDEPADVIDLAEHIEAVRHCLAHAAAARFSPEEHAVLLGLRDGETERTLAARLGMAASTIHARKTTAFHKLRQYLDLCAGRPPGSERPPPADG